MVGSVEARRQGAGEVAEFYIQTRSQQKEIEMLGLAWALKPQSPVLGTHFLSNSATPWGPSIQFYKPEEAILFQTIT